MYSKASYGEAEVTGEARSAFAEAFGKTWEDEKSAGRIMGNPRLMASRSVNPEQLFRFWNKRLEAGKTVKLQAGMIISWIQELEAYAVNAFYPAMESVFHEPGYRMHYYVAEFDSERISWRRFRKKILGATDAAKADPASFRGRYFSRHPVQFAGRDNFIHGSAGPLEGLVERMVHEPGFPMSTNPVGTWLLQRGITPASFATWKDMLTIAELGALFDATEEMDTPGALSELEAMLPSIG
jgi:hypothetical protein